jgi:hypothetical protein
MLHKSCRESQNMKAPDYEELVPIIIRYVPFQRRKLSSNAVTQPRIAGAVLASAKMNLDFVDRNINGLKIVAGGHP